jgi:hypothetical protein
MIEPISLTAVGVFALTEGIKFLYAEAGELLKHRRESKEGAGQEASEPELRPPAEIIEGTVEPTRPNIERLDRLADELQKRRRSLTDYADDVEAVDPSDVALLKDVDELRRLIEVIYGQRITFKGEHREPSGPLVENEVEAMEAEIIDSEVGVVEIDSASGTVKQRTDVTGAKISGGSTVGKVTVGPSRKEEEPPKEEDQP